MADHEPILLYSNAAGQLTADPAGFLRATWAHHARTLTDTQGMFEHMLAHLQQRNWSRILINQVEMTPFNGVEQVWIATNWLPRAVNEGGYRYGAVAVSPAVLVRLATAYVTTSIQGLPLTYRSFDTEAEAERWLQQQPG